MQFERKSTHARVISKLSYLTTTVTLLLIVTLSPVSAQQASTGTIKGSVKASDGTPAEFVTITLKSTSYGTTVNSEGHYALKNVAPGNYTISASFVGLNTQTKQITVTAGETTVSDFILTEDKKQLEEVYVKDYKANKFLRKETDDIAKLPLKNLENPQVYSVVTQELIQEQIVSNYNDAFKNIPGAGIPLVYNNGRSSQLSRGFTTPNLVRNSISGFDYNTVDPANLEKIEAIKGPSGTLFNSSVTSFGGLFNRITKKPYDTFGGNIGYTGGGFDLSRLTADINTPLNADKTILFRVNTALHSEHSFQDAGYTRSVFMAPSFIFKINDRLEVSLEAELSNYSATSAYRLAPYTKSKYHNIKDLPIDYDRSFANNNLNYTSKQYDIFGNINYKISDNWKSQTSFVKTYSTTNGYVTQFALTSDTGIRRNVIKEDFPYYGVDVQQNFIGDFKIGSLRNRLVVGGDYYNQKSNWAQVNVNMPIINFTKPGLAYNNFNPDRVSALMAAAPPVTTNYTKTNQTTYAAYASDVINFTDQLSAMLSLRVDRFQNAGTYYAYNDSTAGKYGQTALAPKFGLVYQVIKDKVSLFGNYMNGFSNNGGTDVNGGNFKPSQANQWEGGIKLDLWQHRISSTISYYDISVTNTLRADPNNSAYQIQDGTQLSKGIEAELLANPLTGLNIVAGYAYNNSRYTAGDASILGLRPAASGPDRMANLWISYQFMDGQVKGLGFGAGANYGSQSYQTNTQTFKFIIPSYTLIDATAFYDRPKYRIGIKVDNLTNQKYWSFRLAPQNPARVSISMNFKIK
jgi:iron complex outermembrane receptor protein